MHLPTNQTNWNVAAFPSETIDVLVDILDSPVTYEIILMLLVVAVCMLLLHILIFFGCVDKSDAYGYDYGDDEDDEDDDEEDEQQVVRDDSKDEDGRRPLNLTLTADHMLVDNEAGGGQPSGSYGTFFQRPGDGEWVYSDG
jgi:nitrogen fixation-related uncharacterized protein